MSNKLDNMSDLLWNKKLFKTFKVASIEDNNKNQNIIDLSTISDSDLIKAPIDFVCDGKDFSSGKRNAIDQMKKIAIEGGLLYKE